MVAVHKKQENKNPQEVKEGNVAVSSIIIESAEQIEVVKAVSEDALTNFKEKMKEEESASSAPPEKNFMWPILLVFILALLLLLGIFLYKSRGVNIENKTNVAMPSPVPTVIPEPTKAVDLTKYEIEIQNGSGISGEAGRQKTSLESEGFTISATGNADNSDYANTIIQAKKEVEKAFIDKLKSVLGDTFALGESEVLPDSSSVPVVVIIGTKK